VRRLLVGAAAAALLVVAFAVHLTTPSTEESLAPFVVRSAPGEWAQGRAVAARVGDARVAATLTDGDWTGTTPGVWVVVTTDAEPLLEPTSVAASLWLGERRYDASDRAGTSTLDGLPLSPGLPSRGQLAFEVPVGALAGHADTARLWIGARPAPELDSVVEVPLDLTGLEPEPELVLATIERTTR
jgi:hypothetical protein